MPIIKSAIKRMRQTATRKARNQRTKRSLRNSLKVFTTKPSATAVSDAQRELDKAVKKGVLKKSTAARKKAQIAKQAKVAGVKPVAKAKKAAAKTTTGKAAPKKAAPAKKPTAKKTEK